MSGRPDFDTYFLGIAKAVAARGDCRRRQIGAVIVDREKRIAGTGYNGSPSGGPSCLKGECPRGLLTPEEVPHDSSYDTGPGICHALHAEMNALLHTDRSRLAGATIYVTARPCDGCRKIIAGTKIERTVYRP